MSALQKIPNIRAFFDILPERERPLTKMTKKFNAYMGDGGNFTFVLIVSNGKYYIGATKRNPIDKEAGNVGLRVAAIRAFRDMNGEDPGYNRQRPESKKAAKMASNYAFVDKVFDRMHERLESLRPHQ